MERDGPVPMLSREGPWTVPIWGPGTRAAALRGAQDSNYWPLTDPFDAGTLTPAPRVTSLWLALDEVTRENGAMEVLPFSAQPESRRNLPQEGDGEGAMMGGEEKGGVLGRGGDEGGCKRYCMC